MSNLYSHFLQFPIEKMQKFAILCTCPSGKVQNIDITVTFCSFPIGKVQKIAILCTCPSGKVQNIDIIVIFCSCQLEKCRNLLYYALVHVGKCRI